MDGKNVADFIDPDIEEKLESLEREEERLVQEGFYDENSDLEWNSEDEREGEAMQEAKGKRLQSQETKKAMKNSARLPRTAGLRTLSQLTDSLTKAGYDPSRIQARAQLLAKAQSIKRKRAEDGGMDVVMEGDEGEGDENEWMDVDEEEGSPQKRIKANSGAVVFAGRGPRSNRQLAGLRDGQVKFALSHTLLAGRSDYSSSSSTASDKGSQASQPRPEGTQLPSKGRRSRSCYQDKNGQSYLPPIHVPLLVLILTTFLIQPKHLFAGKRKMGKTNRR